jgi:serpin B
MRRSVASIALAAALISSAVAAFAQSIDPTPTPDAAAAAAITKDQRAALSSAQARLAWNLIIGAAPGADPTISPAGLASVFAALSEGADLKMKDAIVKSLGFDAAGAKDGLPALKAARASVADADASVFVSKDLIVFSPSQPPSDFIRGALDGAKVPYSISDLAKADSVKKIDAWVAETTKNAIPEILGQPLDKAELVALNALHFKAKWKTPFDPAKTEEASFTDAEKKSDKVQMMHLAEADRMYRKDKGFVAVALPFAGERFSLVVVTSDGDAPKAVKEFEPAASWLSGDGFELRKGDLALPRFSLKGSANLLPVLDKQGLAVARKSAASLAMLAQGAMLDQVQQRAMIDVDEEGAEAAAATAVIMDRSLSMEDVVHMVVDKPFLFSLRDKETGLIVVAGYVGHTPKGKAKAAG